MSNYPKVLLVSHNVLSQTTNNGRTMSGFFKGWPVDKLAELYLNPEIPDSHICERYYRISDLDVLNSIVQFKRPGKRLTADDIKENITNNRTINEEQENLYNLGRKRKPYMYIMRNILWGLNTWNTKDLNAWIDEFSPEIMVYVAGSFAYSYKIALYIAKSRKLPLVVYFSDDYYITHLKNLSPLYWLNRLHFKSVMKTVFHYLSDYICICDEMEKDYAKAFNKKGHVLMTTTNFKPINVKRFDGKFIISFLGNVDFNRSKVLIEVGQVVKKLNSEGYNIEFSIYSGETDKERTKEFTLENGIHFKGKVNYDQVCEAISKSNLLLHVESFDEINRTKTKYSISTKVPDSLASGRCLFAYGPPEVASIKYLKDNDCAYVVTEPNNLERGLRNIVENECLRNQYISKAKQVAKENHNLFKNTMKFKRLLQTAVCKGVQCSLR
jgi:hypothetical protein